MDRSELLKQVRKVEIKTRGLTRQIFSGEYQSAFKGRGISFSEVREYAPGDDVRTIDWNVSARLGKPYIKIFQEERELEVILLVDISRSSEFGAAGKQKRAYATELAATIAFSAMQNNDKVGVIFFSDKIEKYLPPKKGRTYALRIIRELLEIEPRSPGTNVSQALRFLTNARKKRAICFALSDFIAPDFTRALKIAARKHDLIALNVFDKREGELPKVGLIELIDAETGRRATLDSSSGAVRQAYSESWTARSAALRRTFRSAGVDLIELPTDASFVGPLSAFFKYRERRK